MGSDWDALAPGETVLYAIDFAERLADGAALQSASWAAAPSGPLVVTGVGVDAGVANVRIAANIAVLGDAFVVKCTAITTDGQTLVE